MTIQIGKSRSVAIKQVAALSALLLGLVLVPGSAQALTNPERHYEMVSPPYKGGYGVQTLAGTAVTGPAEGERVAFQSLGTFADAPDAPLLTHYLATRSASGWSTVPLVSPSTPNTPHGSTLGWEAYSASLESALFGVELSNYQRESAQGNEEGGPFQQEYLLQPLGAAQASPILVDKPLVTINGSSVHSSPKAWSPDLCHTVIDVPPGGGPLLPEAVGTRAQLYDLSAGSDVAGCGDEAPALRLVAVGNEDGPHGEPKPIDPYCEDVLSAGTTPRNQVAADGHEIFFQANTNSTLTKLQQCDDTFGINGYHVEDPGGLFVRLNGQHTIEVSEPIAADCVESAPCHSAPAQRVVFSGADEAGSRVFFTTIQPLVSGDTEFTCRETSGIVNGVTEGLGEFETQAGCESPSGFGQSEGAKWSRFGDDLYMATLECPGGGEGCPVAEREVTSLVQVSRSEISGETAEVQEKSDGFESASAVAVAADGDRVYFVAHGVLTRGANREGDAPVKGADNLYVYDVAQARNHFVTEMCSGTGMSGQVADRSCPGGSDEDLWRGGVTVQTTGDGEFLVFSSHGQLVPSDTDTAMDIYRYDAASETLVRVSVGENGYDADGNNDLYKVELHAQVATPAGVSRVVSEDGSRIVFATVDPLSPQALNGLSNVYEWHEGQVSLISTGLSTEPEGVNAQGGTLGDSPVITPSGRDIFFVSAQGLVPQDTDGARDVYDARLGEGFPSEPAPRRSCEGDACQGPLTNPAPLLVPGSVSQAPGENVSAPPPASPVKSKTTKKATKKKKKKAKVKQGRHAARLRRAARKTNMGRGR